MSALSDLTLLGILVDNFPYKNLSKFIIDCPASYIHVPPGGIANFLWTEKNCKRIRIKLGYALSTDSNQYSMLRHNDTHMILTDFIFFSIKVKTLWTPLCVIVSCCLLILSVNGSLFNTKCQDFYGIQENEGKWCIFV